MASKLGSFLRNPFSFLFARSSQEDRLATYVIREHVRNRANPAEVRRLLDRPEVIHALGESTVAAEQQRLS